jgi:hypothetical protein
MSLLLNVPVPALGYTKSITLFRCAVLLNYMISHSSTSFRVFKYRRCF